MSRTTQKQGSRQNMYVSRSVRRAFTLVEILVVIAIIAVLMALAVPAFFRWIGTQNTRNTKARVEGIDAIFHQHWNKVRDDAGSTTDPPSFMAYQLAGGDSARAKVIWKKVRLVEAFPISFQEIVGTNGVPWFYAPNFFYNGSQPLIPDKRKYNANYQKTLAGMNVANHNTQTEMAACLLMALQGTPGSGAVGDSLKNYILDTDNDQIGELVDDWRQPLSFFRFPTANTDLQNAAPSRAGANASFLDPLDQTGRLIDPTWYNNANFMVGNQKASAWYEQLFHKISPGAGQPAYYTIPVIVSAGPDKNLGLNADMSVASAAADDNLYSYKLKVGSGAK